MLYNDTEYTEAGLSNLSLSDLSAELETGDLIGGEFEIETITDIGEPGSTAGTEALLAIGNDGDFFGSLP